MILSLDFFTNVWYNYYIMFLFSDFNSRKMKTHIWMAILVGTVFSAAIDDNEVRRTVYNLTKHETYFNI